ncbi:protein of unknown function [Aquiflexum balticum DSM 16537]|uniref:TolB-like 6-blade propeller-like n=1 Tax=Aquiflexum balticum DSM 16537 TaxID=758820 RepID=A0A1W2H382_9BACT|nr:DUF4221 family protein [Aquiflexum balticum]SMD43102.1 protein of unknown function [Aquiflexum balticum DSM 16537]
MPNRFLLPILLIASFSCGKPGEDITVDTFSYSVDTVTVDAKGEILYLEYELRVADYSEVDGFLYNFNKHSHSIEKIDLDQLEWVGTFPLQQEGPDGTGFWISDIKGVREGQLFLSGEKAGIFNLEGELLKKIDWSNVSPEEGGILDEEKFYIQVINPNFPESAFSLFVNYTKNSVILKKLDASQNRIAIIDIDPNDNYKTYTLGDLSTYNHWAPRVNINSQKDKIIVSHEFANDFYVFSPHGDSLQAVNYTAAYTPSKVTLTTEGDLVNSTDDRKNALQYYLGQVSFGRLVWDAKHQRYYRFSSSTQYGEEERMGWLLPEISNSEVYLSVFDADFKLLDEMPIPELNGLPLSKYFVKDGMLWVFVNLDDEMGFIRVSFE